jgi:hypothetical protein
MNINNRIVFLQLHVLLLNVMEHAEDLIKKNHIHDIRTLGNTNNKLHSVTS